MSFHGPKPIVLWMTRGGIVAYMAHGPHLALASKPVAQKKQERHDWETQNSSEMECALPKPKHEPRPALQHKHTLAYMGA